MRWSRGAVPRAGLLVIVFGVSRALQPDRLGLWLRLVAAMAIVLLPGAVIAAKLDLPAASTAAADPRRAVDGWSITMSSSAQRFSTETSLPRDQAPVFCDDGDHRTPSVETITSRGGSSTLSRFVTTERPHVAFAATTSADRYSSDEAIADPLM